MYDLEKNLFVVKSCVRWITGGDIQCQDGETEHVTFSEVRLNLWFGAGGCKLSEYGKLVESHKEVARRTVSGSFLEYVSMTSGAMYATVPIPPITPPDFSMIVLVPKSHTWSVYACKSDSVMGSTDGTSLAVTQVSLHPGAQAHNITSSTTCLSVELCVE